MELTRYEALLCAIETGSLTAASEKLGYTPSGLSRMISSLENEIGFSMLLRRRDGVEATAECNQMLPAIRELLFQAEHCRQIAAKIRGLEIGTVTVGTAYSAYYRWLSRTAAAFHKRYPGIQVQVRNGFSSELLALLERRQVDVCIVSRREGPHDWLSLKKDELMAWVPAGHPLARRKAVPLSAFETESYIDTYPGMDIDNTRVFNRCHIRPNTQFTTMDNFATYSMVEAGLGISMNNALNSIAGSGDVKVLPLSPKQTVEIGIATAMQKSPAVKAFLTFIQNNLPEGMS